MKKKQVTIFTAVLLGAGVSFCVAQSSKIRRISSSVSTLSVGKSSAISSFQAYSAGIPNYGNLYSAPESGGALSSSIQRIQQQTFSTAGRSAATFGGGNLGMSFGKTTKTLAPSAGGLSSPEDFTSPQPAAGGKPASLLTGPAGTAAAESGKVSALASETTGEIPFFSSPAAAAGQAYAAALHTPDDSDASSEKTDDGFLKTLAPKSGGSSQYRRLMREAEAYFRKEDYKLAAQAYETASEISFRAPETQMGLFQVHFATVRKEYNIPSLYLQRVLKEVPELPLIPIHPRDFYGDAGKYVQHVIRLEEYAQANPKDPHAQFVLAYVKWRENQPEQAAAALRRAWENIKNNDEFLDAVQTFWKAMAYAGKVSGELQPSSATPSETEELPVIPAPLEEPILPR